MTSLYFKISKTKLVFPDDELPAVKQINGEMNFNHILQKNNIYYNDGEESYTSYERYVKQNIKAMLQL